jgi:7-cyano-7-deazaguanine reductase
MMKNGDTIEEILINIENRIYDDLSKCLENESIDVCLLFEDGITRKPIEGDFVQVEKFVDPATITFDQFNESPDTLQVVDSDGYPKLWRSSVLRSNCRVTNQPDWGDVYIAIKGDKTVTPESLLQYIVSMRKENHFHEEICECIYKRLQDLINPDELFVACLYTRRGGIDINPLRASSREVMYKYGAGLTDPYSINFKTLRQ